MIAPSNKENKNNLTIKNWVLQFDVDIITLDAHSTFFSKRALYIIIVIYDWGVYNI